MHPFGSQHMSKVKNYHDNTLINLTNMGTQGPLPPISGASKKEIHAKISGVAKFLTHIK